MTSDDRRRASKTSKRRDQPSSSSFARSDSSKSKSRIHHHDNDAEEDLLTRKLERLHDSNGCCHIHSHVQIARKKIMGGWKVLRSCPACNGEEIGLDDDRLSVSSGKSGKSTKSNRSTRSGTYDRGRSSNKEKVKPQYDGEGYCCLHPSVRLAKKKTMGGWKLLVDVCPDCESEGVGVKGSKGRRRSMSRNRSSRSLSRLSRGSKARNDEDDTQSISSTLSKLSARSSRSSSNPTGPRKVKNLKIRDQNRVPGRYSGYVDGKDRPDGKGIIRYENGMEWSGSWCKGEQVSGKLGGCKSKF